MCVCSSGSFCKEAFQMLIILPLLALLFFFSREVFQHLGLFGSAQNRDVSTMPPSRGGGDVTVTDATDLGLAAPPIPAPRFTGDGFNIIGGPSRKSSAPAADVPRGSPLETDDFFSMMLLTLASSNVTRATFDRRSRSSRCVSFELCAVLDAKSTSISSRCFFDESCSCSHDI